MKKFQKLSPEQIAKSVQVFAELKVDRFFWKASGYTDEELSRPVIAVANSPQDVGLGHMHLKQLGEAVKQGVLLGGGVPIEFSTIAPCAGHCRNLGSQDEVLLYDLPQRDAIADSVEIQMRNYNADALICIGTCDKIVPGHWLGAARLDLPTLFLPGGPARPGTFRGQPTAFPTDVALTLINEYLADQISAEQMREQMREMESRWVTGCGACPELTTANTVQMATEAMGLCLPMASTTPGNDMEKLRQAKQTGFRAVQLVREGLRFRDLVTAESIRDAGRLIMALSAGTNGILHLLTLARYLQLDIDVDTFDFLSDDTPYYCPVRPSGPFTVVDLHEAGGVFAILKRIESKVHRDRPTICGRTVGELMDATQVLRPEVILPAEKPIYPTGGIKVLRGNLAPDGSLCRYTISGGQDQTFRGPARVFRSQQAAIGAILGGRIQSGDVVVIHYQGPRGGPGFSENFRVPLILGALGLCDVAVVTDSRFSGATEGALCVGYVSPEAQVGGPLAVVQDDDIVRIDCKSKSLDVELDAAVLAERLAAWQPPRPPITEGVLVDWHLTATQFPDGAMLQRRL
ncbi:dihydroxy-acid dehydratase [Myxococcota bacterium]|nr:dihydroxy-acid dehydratase [Myxococcota bacterium]MCZ7620733.1 dihydroxy-acid dehydratase [Myxococcota bacterium]